MDIDAKILTSLYIFHVHSAIVDVNVLNLNVQIAVLAMKSSQDAPSHRTWQLS